MTVGRRCGPWALGLCLTACRSDATPSPTQAPPPTELVDRAATAWTRLPPTHDPPPARVWWEAEAAIETDLSVDHPFAPRNADEAATLSAGAWLGAASPSSVRSARYAVHVPKSGTYALHARRFWRHGTFRWWFDDTPPRDSEASPALLDAVALRKNVVANWVELGSVELEAGPHRFAIEVPAGTKALALDAFVLSSDAFVPRGPLRPDQASPSPPTGWFAVDPDADPFTDTPIDLRYLNDPPAGRHGFVEVRGDHLVLSGAGTPIRFWGNNASIDILDLSPRRLQRYARRLAKYGVNLVRLHGRPFDPDDPWTIDDRRIAGIQRLADALRTEGIYLGLSIYFPSWLKLRPRHGFDGYDGTQPWGLAYTSDAFDRMARGWWRRLLASPHPTTDLPLARDPILAYVELVNEDSLLFWSFSPYEGFPPPQTIALERRFGSWLAERHGSIDATLREWGGEAQRGDVAEEGRVGFLPLWHVAHDGSRRAAETAEFLARTMRDRFVGWSAFLHDELGFGGVVVCSNWKTADERVLGPLDDWANSACDVMDRHAYVAGRHEGDAAGYAIVPGQTYADRSALRPEPDATPLLPFVEPRYDGKPRFVSELGWPWPNRFRTEGPLLAAAYGALHDIDALMFFASNDATWPRGLDKFSAGDPAFMGQYPAAALVYRRGAVAPAPSLGTIRLPPRSLFALEGLPNDLSPVALAIGPLDVTFAEGPEARTAPSLASTLDRPHRRLHSSDGQIRWDYGAGVVTLQTPSVEAHLGFLGSGPVPALPHLDVDMSTDYASIALVSLDETPLDRSTSMLLQVGTEASPSGWETRGEEVRTIVNVGGPPIVMREAWGTVTLKLDDPDATIVALDVRGRPITEPRSASGPLPLLPQASYYWIRRR